MKSGDKVKYVDDVQTDYIGQIATAIEFDLEHRMVNIEFDCGIELWVFWDEIILSICT